MASLREIKDRIGSVRSTLKITSAMKLVASAKLRKAQKAIEGMRPYERTLAEILAAVGPLRFGVPASRRPSSLPADAGTGFGATNPAAAELSPSGNAATVLPAAVLCVGVVEGGAEIGFSANLSGSDATQGVRGERPPIIEKRPTAWKAAPRKQIYSALTVWAGSTCEMKRVGRSRSRRMPANAAVSASRMPGMLTWTGTKETK